MHSPQKTVWTGELTRASKATGSFCASFIQFPLNTTFQLQNDPRRQKSAGSHDAQTPWPHDTQRPDPIVTADHITDTSATTEDMVDQVYLFYLNATLLNTRPARTTKISWWAHVRERRCFIWFRRWINRTALIMTSHPSNRTSSRTSRVVHGWRTLSIRLWPRHWATSLRLKWGTRSVDWPLTLSSRQHV